MSLFSLSPDFYKSQHTQLLHFRTWSSTIFPNVPPFLWTPYWTFFSPSWLRRRKCGHPHILYSFAHAIYPSLPRAVWAFHVGFALFFPFSLRRWAHVDRPPPPLNPLPPPLKDSPVSFFFSVFSSNSSVLRIPVEYVLGASCETFVSSSPRVMDIIRFPFCDSAPSHFENDLLRKWPNFRHRTFSSAILRRVPVSPYFPIRSLL